MNQDRFKKSVIAHYRQMFDAAASILRDRDKAADAIQDAMVSLWNIRDRLDNVENIRGYCIMVARHKALDALKRFDATSFDPIPEKFDCADTNDTSPSSAIEQKQETARLKAIIGSLPDNQRRVMVLSALHNLSNQEIASVTGLSDQNIRTLLCRARQKVRQLYLQQKSYYL